MSLMKDEVSRYAHRLRSLEESELHPLRSILSRAINEGASPGVSVWIGVDDQGEEGLIERSIIEGRDRFDGLAPKLSPDRIFDLASLTKALATARWYGALYDQGLVDRDTAIGEFISCEDTSLAKTSIWRLLNHSAGLPAHREYHKGFIHSRMNGGEPRRFKSQVRRMIAATSTEYIPGERSIYSDLGYLLLEEVCEKISGESLSEAWMGLKSNKELHFRPLSAIEGLDQDREIESDLEVYVPTEQCVWRKRLLRGEVHDDNAWLMGGVCGHAGLFGTARSVGLEALSWLRAFHGNSETAGLSTVTAKWMLDLNHRAPQRGSFVLGWDTPSPGYSSSGSSFSRHTVGHLGFTGTSLWIDLERRVVMVVLTNRVYPDRKRAESQAGIRWLRPAIHNEIWRLLRSVS